MRPATAADYQKERRRPESLAMAELAHVISLRDAARLRWQAATTEPGGLAAGVDFAWVALAPGSLSVRAVEGLRVSAAGLAGVVGASGWSARFRPLACALCATFSLSAIAVARRRCAACARSYAW